MLLNKYINSSILLYIFTLFFLNTLAKDVNSKFSNIVNKRKFDNSRIYHSFPIDNCIRCEKEDYSKELSYCKKTGYKQLVQWSMEEVNLKENEKIENYKLHIEDIIISPGEEFNENELPKYRACYHQKHSNDIKSFFKFQLWTLTIGFSTFLIVMYRKKKNMKKHYLDILRLIGK